MCDAHPYESRLRPEGAKANGLLMLNQKSMEFLKRLCYFAYEYIGYNQGESDRMVKNLGQYKALIMQISDLFVVGDTIAQAFGTMHLLHETCEIQFIARAGSGPPTAPPPG